MKRIIVALLTGAVLTSASVAASAASWSWYQKMSLGQDAAVVTATDAGYHQKAFWYGQFKISAIAVDGAKDVAFISTEVERDKGKILVVDLATWTTLASFDTINSATTIKFSGSDAYALCNQIHSNSNNDTTVGQHIYKISKVNNVWTSTKIYDAPRNSTDDPTVTSFGAMRGIAVDDFGNVSWLYRGDTSDWKGRSVWTYDIVRQSTPECVTSGNTGWSDPFKGSDNFVYVGLNTESAPIWAMNQFSNYSTQGISIRTIQPGLNKTDCVTKDQQATYMFSATSHVIYDAARSTFWVGSIGRGGTCALGQVKDPDTSTGWLPMEGIATAIHAAPDLNWGKANVYVGAMALEPVDGSVLYSVCGEPAVNFGDGKYETSPYYGCVLKAPADLDGDISKLSSEGRPDPAGQVVALAKRTSNGRYLAVTLDASGYYKLYESGPIEQLPVSGIKAKGTGAVVSTNGAKTVTFVGTGYFYIEDTDRAGGIKVIPVDGQEAVAVNDTVTVTGTVAEVDKEAVLRSATYVKGTPAATAIKPLGMPIRSLGGNKFGVQPATDVAYGLNTVGLLVKVAGKVPVAPPGDVDTDLWFTVDDGTTAIPSAQTKYMNWDGSLITINGLKVAWSPSGLGAGTYVSVTGVLTIEAIDTNGDLVKDTFQRVIKPRTAADVKIN